MTAWTDDDLATIGAADELRIATQRGDGTLRKPVIVWVVRHGDELYIRAVKGRTGPWFRGAQDQLRGRIRAGGVERDVALADAGGVLDDQLDEEYRVKYGRYPAAVVDSVITAAARSATLRLLPYP